MHLLLEAPCHGGRHTHPVDGGVLLVDAGRDGQCEPQNILLLRHVSLFDCATASTIVPLITLDRWNFSETLSVTPLNIRKKLTRRTSKCVNDWLFSYFLSHSFSCRRNPSLPVAG